MSSKVTVIMPAKNESRYISDSIKSIINQTYNNWELLIVNDRSTDETGQIALNFAKSDKRIRVYDGEGICAANARNLAISYASGEYIMNMDADDFSVPDRMEKLLQIASKYSLAFVGSYIEYVDHNLRFKKLVKKPISNRSIRKGFERSFARYTIVPGSVMASTEILKKVRYNEFFKSMEDWDLILRISDNKDVVFENYPEPLYKYRLNEGSMTLVYHTRIRYNLMLRYNEIQRKKQEKEEAKSLEEFMSIVKSKPSLSAMYSVAYLLKMVQHGLFIAKHKYMSKLGVIH